MEKAPGGEMLGEKKQYSQIAVKNPAIIKNKKMMNRVTRGVRVAKNGCLNK